MGRHIILRNMKMLLAYLVSVWNIDRLPALGDVPDDAGTPGDPDLVLLLHLHQRALGADVEQLGDQAPAPGGLARGQGGTSAAPLPLD